MTYTIYDWSSFHILRSNFELYNMEKTTLPFKLYRCPCSFNSYQFRIIDIQQIVNVHCASHNMAQLFLLVRLQWICCVFYFTQSKPIHWREKRDRQRERKRDKEKWTRKNISKQVLIKINWMNRKRCACFICIHVYVDSV